MSRMRSRGLSNRLLGRWAEMVFLSFPGCENDFGRVKTLVTGNPLRPGFAGIPEALAEPGKLLIFGGSRGARAINRMVTQMLPILKGWAEKPYIVHQTGEEDHRQVRRAYRDAGYEQAEVVPFIDDMAAAYSAASLIVCRAGATTLAELTACGRPAILIPFPFAAADHQTANAEMLAAAGAARMIRQDEVDALRLATEIGELLADREGLQRMAQRGRRLARPGAAELILNTCRGLLAPPAKEVG